MPYTPIVATLGYILSPDGRRVLLVHRNKRINDAHYGKYNGLGGKLEAGEDIVSCLQREVREESGLECEQLRLRRVRTGSASFFWWSVFPASRGRKTPTGCWNGWKSSG
jgi:8-oxo-dGTP pyrophosphatase MutT (NUDIX family)